MDDIITIEDVHFKYVGRKAEALQGVNLRIKKGETLLLLGPSGSGKSTLALTMNGLIPHSVEGRFSGSVHVAGMETTKSPLARLTQHAGIVFQDPEAQFVTMTVENEIAFGLENLRIPQEEMPTRIRMALARVGLEDRLRSRVDHLSGGGKQRLALASILAMEPEILIFDEPTANLDPAGTREVFNAIGRLKQTGTYTLILIEHKLDALMHLIDRVVVLAPGGTTLVDGSPREVFRDHMETLMQYGVWMPQVALLAYELRKQGITLDPFPITIDEAVQVLRHAPVVHTPSPEPVASRTTLAPPAIEVRDLSFAYANRQVLDQISLRVPQGDFLAIVGANGAGKTTLAQHLIDIHHPPRGTVFVAGRDITRIPVRELIQMVGYVFQNPENQFITDSVEHELAFGLRLMKLPEAEIQRRVAETLEQFGLSRYARANPFTLSHGEKRRLSVATMLVVGQQILILDEPTFGQDERNATELLTRLKHLHEAGRTIIVITHDMSLVAQYTQHVAVLAEGRLIFHGATPDLFNRLDLLREARLAQPPLAELSHRLTEYNAAWSGLLTVEQFVEAAIPAVAVKEA